MTVRQLIKKLLDEADKNPSIMDSEVVADYDQLKLMPDKGDGWTVVDFINMELD